MLPTFGPTFSGETVRPWQDSWTCDTMPTAVAAGIASGWLIDHSWHNDACPSVVTASTYRLLSTKYAEDVPRLWVEHVDPDHRETGSALRFAVQVGPERYLETDDVDVALMWLGQSALRLTVAGDPEGLLVTCAVCGEVVADPDDVTAPVDDDPGLLTHTHCATDLTVLTIHCEARSEAGEEISDAAARTVAALWHDGSAPALSFLSTGAIVESTTVLWGRFFGDYSGLSARERLVADMFGTYLLNRSERGPVPGWSGLWVR
jgi:hypothetical protein